MLDDVLEAPSWDVIGEELGRELGVDVVSEWPPSPPTEPPELPERDAADFDHGLEEHAALARERLRQLNVGLAEQAGKRGKCKGKAKSADPFDAFEDSLGEAKQRWANGQYSAALIDASLAVDANPNGGTGYEMQGAALHKLRMLPGERYMTVTYRYMTVT